MQHQPVKDEKPELSVITMSFVSSSVEMRALLACPTRVDYGMGKWRDRRFMVSFNRCLYKNTAWIVGLVDF